MLFLINTYWSGFERENLTQVPFRAPRESLTFRQKSSKITKISRRQGLGLIGKFRHC